MTDFLALASAGRLAQNAEPGGFPTIRDGWAAEPKYDGWRIIVVIGDGHVDFFSRSGKTYNGKLPKVEAELLAHFPVGTVLDGEVVALTVHGDAIVNEWGVVQSVLTKLGGKAVEDKITFMVFDLIAHRGIDARPLEWLQRRDLLEQIFENETFESIALTPVVAPTDEQYASLIERGFEGMVLKRLNAPYASGKREGAGWRKAKPTISVEGVIMGFQEGKSGFAGMVGAVIFGQFDNGVLTERGRVSGMDMRTRLSMTNEPQKWVGTVIEVLHEGVSIGQTDSGRFRFPRWGRPRPDRAAESVVLHDA